ncbi:NapC/NirT family cytochrome c [Pelagicoccus mobilis]|uniref:NapC/NirT family cytochrome c n=1 Tax=Pelagicoccus mobilis TaxID=415221 RepID=A0A934VNL7_9BACT|nr:NapC/NirT family cytochrome c [Pelagicoccus mobilis]MBK1880086.1 NapC/NirT family cytochrome c [Pelagicoccus mobilis]
MNPLTYFRNWLSLVGLTVMIGSLFAFLLLFAFDLTTSGSNPYVGLLTYIVAPLFLSFGSILAIGGWFWDRARRKDSASTLHFDLSRLRDRRIFFVFVGGAITFMFATSIGSYQTYTYSNSNHFCGTLCHSVMEPQFVAYPNSGHAKLKCIDCHIGEGTSGTIKAKWHGLYKVYSLLLDKYPTPLAAAPNYLPTTEESCLKCHENGPDLKDVARTYHHYLSDDDNTPFSVSLRLKLGPDETTAAKTSGIHWHAKPENRVEFTETKENPNVIPWIRYKSPDGLTTEYHFTPDEETEDLPDLTEVGPTHTMDCLDCHSRPAHDFAKPNDIVEAFLRSNSETAPALPELKYIIAKAVDQEFESQSQVMESIAKELEKEYSEQEIKTQKTITHFKEVFGRSVFPEMKADWRTFPNHIGHKDTLGCFRCHDDKHSTADGSKTLSAKNCNTCHDVISQGVPGQMEFANSPDTEFEHPDGSYLGFTCAECHTGALQLE